MSAVDRLMVKLGRMVHVGPSIREGGHVDAYSYWRKDKIPGSSAPSQGLIVHLHPLEGFDQSAIVDDAAGERVGLVTFSPFDSGITFDGVDRPKEQGLSIDEIAVAPTHKREGIASAMLAKLHGDTGQPLVHGSFSSLEGARLGMHMAAAYPAWNKLWLEIEPDHTTYWNPGDDISPDASTFDPIDYAIKDRLHTAIIEELNAAR